MELDSEWEVVEDSQEDSEWEVVEDSEEDKKIPWSEVPGNFARDFFDNAKGVGTMATYSLPFLSPLKPGQKETNELGIAVLKSPKEIPKQIFKSISSPVESFKQRPFSTVMDWSIVGDLGLRGASGIARSLRPAAASVGKKMASSILGPSEEAINARLTRNADLKAAPKYADIANDVSTTADDLTKRIAAQYDEQMATLTNKPIGTTSEATSFIDEIKDSLKTKGQIIGDANQQAYQKISDIESKLYAMGGKPKSIFKDPYTGATRTEEAVTVPITEIDAKNLISALDPNAGWSMEVTPRAKVKLQQFRNYIDKKLKDQNTNYREAVARTEKSIKTRDSLQTALSLKKEGSKYYPKDATISSLKSLPQERKSISQSALESVKSETGKDFVDQAKMAGYAEQFEPGATRPAGSRRVNIGATVGGALGSGAGAMVGGWGGAALGGGLGSTAGVVIMSYIDKYGGAAAGRMIDSYLKAQARMPALTLEKFLPKYEAQFERTAIPLTVLSDTERNRDVRNTGSAAASILGMTQGANILKRILDEKNAMDYLERANDDPKKARQMAEQDGWVIP